MKALAQHRDRIVSGYREAMRPAARNDPAWLADVRSAAIDRFGSLGFPTRKREDWKYTNVAPIAEFFAGAFDRNIETRTKVDDIVDTSSLAHVLVFVDGHCDRRLSHISALPSGAVIDSLSRVFRERPDRAEPALTRAAGPDDRAFVALNTAFQQSGAFVSIPRGIHIETPIHLIFVATAASDAHTHHPHNVIQIGADARATVVTRYVSVGGSSYATNSVSDIEIADGAQLDHIGLERESPGSLHLGTITARIGRDARFRSHAISLGAGLARHEVRAVLAGTGAECTLNGLYIASGDRHVDNQTVVEHTQAHGTSRELYKGILGGRSRGVFNGALIVHPGAQKTDAQQSNPNLLISGHAEVNTRPNLEIRADDVKCAHSSTVGRLDDDALFFLRARGIHDRSARQMLCHAFASEVIQQIPDEPLRGRLSRRVDEALLAAGRSES